MFSWQWIATTPAFGIPQSSDLVTFRVWQRLVVASFLRVRPVGQPFRFWANGVVAPQKNGTALARLAIPRPNLPRELFAVPRKPSSNTAFEYGGRRTPPGMGLILDQRRRRRVLCCRREWPALLPLLPANGRSGRWLSFRGRTSSCARRSTSLAEKAVGTARRPSCRRESALRHREFAALVAWD